MFAVCHYTEVIILTGKAFLNNPKLLDITFHEHQNKLRNLKQHSDLSALEPILWRVLIMAVIERNVTYNAKILEIKF